jgi:23S rRNA pseudouridine955/2504/2580 synthase
MVNQNPKTNAFSTVSWIEITEHQHAQRIDNFLFRLLKGVPKSRIYRILRKGEVRVNKSRVKPEYKLQKGDTLRIPPIRTPQSEPGTIVIPAWVRAAVSQPLFEDDALIVINKPAGLAVHGGSGIEFGLIEVMRQLKPEQPFLELVHRIDRETSGCLLLAKSRPALNQLHQQFRREEGQMEKVYLAVLSGGLSEVNTVNAPLLQSRDGNGMKRAVIDPKGQAAKSTFMPIEVFDKASYVRILLYTGRMHQARVHATHLGLPILGDKLYGDRDANRKHRSTGVKRCLLHAERYQLNHPLSGEMMQFNAPLPRDFNDVLMTLRHD